MTEALGFADAASRARTMAAALALGCSLDHWSLALVVLAMAGLLWAPSPLSSSICLLASLLAGGAQKIYALRVAFDAALFRYWTETWAAAATQGSYPAALAADLAALDQALAACGLCAPSEGTLRGLDSRLRGAGKLLRWQALALAIQFAAIIVALVAMRLLPTG
jgi:hypothetical protein